MESKTQDFNISSRNRVFYLHKLVSFTDNCRENKQTNKQKTKQSFPTGYKIVQQMKMKQIE